MKKKFNLKFPSMIAITLFESFTSLHMQVKRIKIRIIQIMLLMINKI